MSFNYYPKLAIDAIKKNNQLYFPYILTCILMVSIYYVLSFLINSEFLLSLPGSSFVEWMLVLGSWIIIIFSIIILFYTSSFLIRRRKKEFGIYSVLGLSKRNIIHILSWESIIIGLISLILGLLIGILFSKLFELGLLNILQTDLNYEFNISINSIITTIIVYSGIFFLLYLSMVLQISFLNISQLLNSENVGEKPPKGNWILALIGLISLFIGYGISLYLKDPLSALLFFFIAVVFVIIGVYLLLISGSVFICRILQKNKTYYYKTNHFISVSSMVYRMKRNGAGLASICILSTMVLVILCSTVCLYIGIENSLINRYPKEINLSLNFNNISDLSISNIDTIQSKVNEIVHENNQVILDSISYTNINTMAHLIDNQSFLIDTQNLEEITLIDDGSFCYLNFITLADYNRLTGSNQTLENGEVIVYNTRSNIKGNELSINNISFKIKKVTNKIFEIPDYSVMIFPTVTLIVNDLDYSWNQILQNSDSSLLNYIQYNYSNNFNIGGNIEEQIELSNKLNNEFDNEEFRNQTGINYSLCDSREANRNEFLSYYGSLLYLGFIISIVFIFATILIIYYKQISEGFEDQSRFQIMKNIGLSNHQIKKTINSQLLTVFFIPLIFAIVNIVFAFPIIEKILIALNFNDSKLFIITTIGCILIFSLFYIIVYKITSNEYYKIVK